MRVGRPQGPGDRLRAGAGEDGERVQHIEQFATTVRGLLVLRDWLEAHRVTNVVMEATGVYCSGSRGRRNTALSEQE